MAPCNPKRQRGELFWWSGTYFINRGGKGLTEERRNELEKAKKLLSNRVHREKSSQ
jgi:hypothetical protein